MKAILQVSTIGSGKCRSWCRGCVFYQKLWRQDSLTAKPSPLSVPQQTGGEVSLRFVAVRLLNVFHQSPRPGSKMHLLGILVLVTVHPKQNNLGWPASMPSSFFSAAT